MAEEQDAWPGSRTVETQQQPVILEVLALDITQRIEQVLDEFRNSPEVFQIAGGRLTLNVSSAPIPDLA